MKEKTEPSFLHIKGGGNGCISMDTPFWLVIPTSAFVSEHFSSQLPLDLFTCLCCLFPQSVFYFDSLWSLLLSMYFISTYPYFYIPLFSFDLFLAAMCASFLLPTYSISYSFGFFLCIVFFYWLLLQQSIVVLFCCLRLFLKILIIFTPVYFYIDSLIYKFIFWSKCTSEAF